MAFVYILLGFLGGVLSGMGMGGGTILIPFLTTILGLMQKQAQFLNLFSFIFMSVFVVAINIKNKLINPFQALVFALPGLITSFIAAFLVRDISESFLKILFGVFLIFLALWQLINIIKQEKNLKK